MKFRKPLTIVKDEIQKPIQTIAVVALIALAVSAIALFIALERNSNATGS